MARTPPKPGVSQHLAVINRDDASYEFLNGLIKDINTASAQKIQTYSYGIAS